MFVCVCAQEFMPKPRCMGAQPNLTIHGQDLSALHNVVSGDVTDKGVTRFLFRREKAG